jgi:vacuolar-type H+-ATPase subunit I/STV1
MKRIIIVLICIVFSSCKKDEEEKKLIYNQLINYRNELKFAVKDQKFYIVEHINENKKRKDSLIEILNELNISFEKLKYGERNKIVELRNTFNKKYNLHENFKTSNYSENISDTIFNRLMEIDFLKLERNFQVFYLLPRGCM